MNREKTIVRVSIQGIVVNLILVAFKAAVGFAAGSIAIILDAVNNLSDALSQVITIVGTKLSQREPDKQHPYGYGRIEYISSAIVAMIVLMAGFTSARESLVKTLHPDAADYTAVSLIIIGVAVVVKFVFGRYVKSVGEKVQSQSLIASGTDAFMDSILSFSTFVAALISRIFGVTLEGILGLVLSVFIIKAGLGILTETLGSIIGSRVDSDFSVGLKKQLRAYPGVRGAYDLVLHDYGPSRSIGSVHLEVDADMTAAQFDKLSRRVIADVQKEHGIILTVGLYANNDGDPDVLARKQVVAEVVKKQEHIIGFHGFFADDVEKRMSFDIVVSHHAPSATDIAASVAHELEARYPGYMVKIGIDHDFSD